MYRHTPTNIKLALLDDGDNGVTVGCGLRSVTLEAGCEVIALKIYMWDMKARAEWESKGRAAIIHVLDSVECNNNT